MNYMNVVENRIYEDLKKRDMLYGVIIGTVPPIFLGAFTPIYAVLELIVYAVTKNKIWLYASIASFIVSIVMLLVYYSSGYRNFLNREINILPFKFS